ncbi:hypothetical protein ACFWZJ_23170 [Streptomyces massasporeus]
MGRGNGGTGKSSIATGLRAPHAYEVGEAQLCDRYRELDLLPGGVETAIGADSSLGATVDRIMLDTGPAGLPALGLQSPVPVTRSYVPGRA